MLFLKKKGAGTNSGCKKLLEPFFSCLLSKQQENLWAGGFLVGTAEAAGPLSDLHIKPGCSYCNVDCFGKLLTLTAFF